MNDARECCVVMKVYFFHVFKCLCFDNVNICKCIICKREPNLIPMNLMCVLCAPDHINRIKVHKNACAELSRIHFKLKRRYAQLNMIETHLLKKILDSHPKMNVLRSIDSITELANSLYTILSGLNWFGITS